VTVDADVEVKLHTFLSAARYASVTNAEVPFTIGWASLAAMI
jgi:hypothetical protein